jgi:hypothetical protein
MKLPRRRRLLYLSRITVTIGFAIALAAPTASDAAEIKVLTTRAMNHVLTELAGEFQRTNEHKITLNLAPPAEIKRRIVNGEIVDVAMSGSGAIEDLVQQGKVVPDSKLILARVGTGVAVRGGSGETGHQFCRSLQTHALGGQINCLYRSSGQRSERQPFREGSRSTWYRQRDQSQVDLERQSSN